MDGEVNIDSASWALQSAHVKMLNGLNVNWIRHLVIENTCLLYTSGTAEKLFNKGLCIPAGPFVTDEDVAYIVNEIRKQLR